MTIEIEAGASQSQCSMETASVHAVSKGNWDRVDGEFFAVSAEHPRCTSSFHQKERNRDTPLPPRRSRAGVCRRTLRVEIDTVSLLKKVRFSSVISLVTDLQHGGQL